MNTLNPRLTSCPDCGRTVSKKAIMCPGCGRKHPGSNLNRRLLMAFFAALAVALLVAGILIPAISQAKTNALQTRIKSDMKALSITLNLYHVDTGKYPASLQDLIQKPSSASQRWKGPYLKGLPRDPWGRKYIYQSTQNGFRIISYGADGKVGGTGINADIVWER